jgi:uncharacterized protein YqhQ
MKVKRKTFKNHFKNNEENNETEEQTVKQDDCTFLLAVNDGVLNVYVNWIDELNPKIVGNVLGDIATGKILSLLLQEITNYLTSTGYEDQLEIIHETLKEIIKEHRKETMKELGYTRPVVEPIGAIRRQMEMYRAVPQGDE